uniref:RmlD-like substrate binding domain-containing protein n=1 Tax=Mucochytrium quahogii TaxID=96639 RepID=A0A7S2W5K9_9STRA|mmetsp:Transcript_17661/g.28585  ORF Transcript_17661/g.28585 Transcript_17661/m.28585 type:complete len:323 (-) Transcript_17661:125-1093(-)|eukprot:CAMPEP_0203753778 /NCGR_PEP_ID=MMETSP0098-20131031/7494_1 /ASSEMBLY_ACC=CAM_ASM_000208 /TAXON_ID=96639 /ORGANISM=" , Strain NY0313808BC1" /LENGTH=322 /DNA_ID=CAMNT_0050644525 /DNA_START=1197 /DNA_END=2165 /DNA_ORIENTATION=-
MVVLVLGGSGELGQNVVRVAIARGLECVATYTSSEPYDNLIAPLVTWYRFNLVDGTIAGVRKKFQALVEKSDITCVINCSVCKHDANQEPKVVEEFVVDRTVNIIGAVCAEHKIRLLQLSTDLVFDGKTGNYSEEANPTPVMWYGECKAKMEKGLLQLEQLSTCILRTSLLLTVEPSLKELLGRNRKRSKCAHFCVSRALDGQSTGTPAGFFTDEIRSVTFSEDLANALVDLGAVDRQAFNSDCCGILNAVASRSLSRLELAEVVLNYYSSQFDGPKPVLSGVLSRDLFQGSRPLDCTLDTSRYESLRAKYSLCRLRWCGDL